MEFIPWLDGLCSLHLTLSLPVGWQSQAGLCKAAVSTACASHPAPMETPAPSPEPCSEGPAQADLSPPALGTAHCSLHPWRLPSTVPWASWAHGAAPDPGPAEAARPHGVAAAFLHLPAVPCPCWALPLLGCAALGQDWPLPCAHSAQALWGWGRGLSWEVLTPNLNFLPKHQRQP